MATVQQRKAFKAITEQIRKGTKVSVSKAMRESGFSKSVSAVPSKLTESKGFQELLDEAGLTDQFLNKALYDDIKKKKGNRKAELELAYKLRGRLKETQSGNINNILNVTLSDEQFSRIAGRLTGRGVSDGGVSSETQSSGLRDSNESEVPTELAPREDSEGA